MSSWAYDRLEKKHHDDDAIVVTEADIVGYLSWKPYRTRQAMANLRATGEIPQGEDAHEPQPTIKKEIFKMMPTKQHATEFRKLAGIPIEKFNERIAVAEAKEEKVTYKRIIQEPRQKKEISLCPKCHTNEHQRLNGHRLRSIKQSYREVCNGGNIPLEN